MVNFIFITKFTLHSATTWHEAAQRAFWFCPWLNPYFHSKSPKIHEFCLRLHSSSNLLCDLLKLVCRKLSLVKFFSCISMTVNLWKLFFTFDFYKYSAVVKIHILSFFSWAHMPENLLALTNSPFTRCARLYERKVKTSK